MSDQPIKNSDQPMDNSRIDTPPKTGDSMERFQSGDSESFFEQLDDVDDFAPVGKPSGGAKGLSQKMSKRDDQKGGGSGGIYSTKHIRQKEALLASKKSAEKK
jgi:hypothetical protein